MLCNEFGFTGGRKNPVVEGYGLQPVRKSLKAGTALAAEGTVFPSNPLFPHTSAAKAEFIAKHLRMA
jgi:hypothetical protein